MRPAKSTTENRKLHGVRATEQIMMSLTSQSHLHVSTQTVSKVQDKPDSAVLLYFADFFMFLHTLQGINSRKEHSASC